MRSVKQGEVYLPYDTSFVFGEVNGDRVFWEVEEGGPMKVIRVDTKCVGKMISTKAVGNDSREDITHEYKHPEGKPACPSALMSSTDASNESESEQSPTKKCDQSSLRVQF